jgi:hypothetical protein
VADDIDRLHSRAATLAEVDGNRTRQAEILGFVGFEDRGDHQAADTSWIPGAYS